MEIAAQIAEEHDVPPLCFRTLRDDDHLQSPQASALVTTCRLNLTLELCLHELEFAVQMKDPAP